MTQPVPSCSVTSFAAELAQLLIQNEATQSDADRTQRDAARATFLQDAQCQVDELHAAASAAELGAFVGAAFGIASAGCAIGAAGSQYDADMISQCDPAASAAARNEANTLQAVSKGFSGLTGVASQVGGGTASDHDKADAKHFETLAEQAKWQSDDATTEINKADTLGGKILDIVQSLNQDQNSATNAVIGRI